MESKIEKKEVEEIKSVTLVAKEFEIVDQGDFETSVLYAKVLKEKIKLINLDHNETINFAHKAWKGVISIRDKNLSEFKEALQIFEDKQEGYNLEQDKIQEALDLKARQNAENEEKELIDDLEIEGVKALEDGNINKANEIQEEINTTFIPATAVNIVKKRTFDSSGNITSSKKKDFDVEINDIKKVLSAIINGKLPYPNIKEKEITLTIAKIKERVKQDKYSDVEILNYGLSKIQRSKTRIL